MGAADAAVALPVGVPGVAPASSGVDTPSCVVSLGAGEAVLSMPITNAAEGEDWGAVAVAEGRAVGCSQRSFSICGAQLAPIASNKTSNSRAGNIHREGV